MVKKYLSLEEAARILKIDPMELQRMRERGEIRAFADRGNWKFREDEVEELLRARQADSSPEVPIQLGDDLDESIFFEDDTDSDVKMTDGKSPSLSDSGSDSDVRLVFDESLDGPGSSSDIKIPQLGDSDSDVRLGTPGKKKGDSEEGIDLDFGSDSNIRLDATDPLEKKYPGDSSEEIKLSFGSDSEIRLTTDSSASDSDVKLVPTPADKVDSDSDVKLIDPNKKDLDSDSDVKLIDPNKKKKSSDSDSDVKLTDINQKTEPHVDMVQASDSDVKLVSDFPGLFDEDSDSDVKLTGSMADFEVPSLGSPPVTPPPAAEEEEELEVDLRGLGSDSDVKLFKGDEDEYNMLDVDATPTWANENQPAVPQGATPVAGKLPGDSDVPLETEDDDSGIKLSTPADSGIRLDADAVVDDEDSGIALDFGDSGITLEKDEDSGIALDLGADSGIALDSPADSGIALEDISDSGIPLDIPDKKGKPAHQERTQPLMNAYSGGAQTPDATNMEVPLGEEESEYALTNDLDDTANNVTLFEEDELQIPAKGKPAKKGMETSSEIDVSLYEVGTTDDDELGLPNDDYAMELQGEHDEFAESEDVFGAADEDFQEGMQSGQSAADFAMPVARKPAAEIDWGTGVFVGLALSSVVMVLTGWVMFDLVRTMWVADDPTVPTGALLSAIKGIFG